MWSIHTYIIHSATIQMTSQSHTQVQVHEKVHKKLLTNSGRPIAVHTMTIQPY